MDSLTLKEIFDNIEQSSKKFSKTISADLKANVKQEVK